MDIYIDGSSFGNPGDAGIGVIFSQGENTVKNLSRYIGKETNNVAEYTALIYALREALIMNLRVVNLYSDSELLVRQVKREYKVKNEGLKNLFDQATGLIKGFEHFSITRIPREQNSGADKLARLAIKNRSLKTDARSRPVCPCAREESPSSSGQRSG